MPYKSIESIYIRKSMQCKKEMDDIRLSVRSFVVYGRKGWYLMFGCIWTSFLNQSATKTEAISATFTYLPSEIDVDSGGDKSQKLDWSLAAKASPCYATVWKTSYCRGD